MKTKTARRRTRMTEKGEEGMWWSYMKEEEELKDKDVTTATMTASATR